MFITTLHKFTINNMKAKRGSALWTMAAIIIIAFWSHFCQ